MTERGKPVGMYEFVNAVEEVIKAADPAKRQALAETIDARSDDLMPPLGWGKPGAEVWEMREAAWGGGLLSNCVCASADLWRRLRFVERCCKSATTSAAARLRRCITTSFVSSLAADRCRSSSS